MHYENRVSNGSAYIRYLFFLSLNRYTQCNRSNEMQANTFSVFCFNNNLMNGISRSISGHDSICNNSYNKEQVHLKDFNSGKREEECCDLEKHANCNP